MRNMRVTALLALTATLLASATTAVTVSQNSGGFGNSAAVEANPLAAGMVMSTLTWPTGFSAAAFQGAVYDGQSIWLVPYSATAVVKIDKTSGVMTAYSNWPSGFTKDTGSFIGGCFDGQYIWLAPSSASHVLRIDKDSATMTAHNNWPSGFSINPGAFAGGCFDGQFVWLAPYTASHVLKIDKDSLTMTAYNSWPSGFSAPVGAFLGICFDGQAIWLVPYNALAVVKIDKTTAAMTAYDNWPSGYTADRSAFQGACFDGQYVWLVPNYATHLIKVDKSTGAMTGYTNWPSGFTKGGNAFSGGCFDGQSIWLTPYNANAVVKIDKDTSVMTAYSNWPTGFGKNSAAFIGSAFDGSSVYFAPVYAGKVLKLSSPVTPAPTTAVPVTPTPSTATPATPVPSTATPATPVPSTATPATPVPSTATPATATPATATPSTATPSTATPATATPTTATPTTATPTTPVPSTATPAPTPATVAPSTAVPSTTSPATQTPTTTAPEVPPAAPSSVCSWLSGSLVSSCFGYQLEASTSAAATQRGWTLNAVNTVLNGTNAYRFAGRYAFWESTSNRPVYWSWPLYDELAAGHFSDPTVRTLRLETDAVTIPTSSSASEHAKCQAAVESVDFAASAFISAIVNADEKLVYDDKRAMLGIEGHNKIACTFIPNRADVSGVTSYYIFYDCALVKDSSLPAPACAMSRNSLNLNFHTPVGTGALPLAAVPDASAATLADVRRLQRCPDLLMVVSAVIHVPGLTVFEDFAVKMWIFYPDNPAVPASDFAVALKYATLRQLSNVVGVTMKVNLVNSSTAPISDNRLASDAVLCANKAIIGAPTAGATQLLKAVNRDRSDRYDDRFFGSGQAMLHWDKSLENVAAAHLAESAQDVVRKTWSSDPPTKVYPGFGTSLFCYRTFATMNTTRVASTTFKRILVDHVVATLSSLLFQDFYGNDFFPYSPYYSCQDSADPWYATTTVAVGCSYVIVDPPPGFGEFDLTFVQACALGQDHPKDYPSDVQLPAQLFSSGVASEYQRFRELFVKGTFVFADLLSPVWTCQSSRYMVSSSLEYTFQPSDCFSSLERGRELANNNDAMISAAYETLLGSLHPVTVNKYWFTLPEGTRKILIYGFGYAAPGQFQQSDWESVPQQAFVAYQNANDPNPGSCSKLNADTFRFKYPFTEPQACFAGDAWMLTPTGPVLAKRLTVGVNHVQCYIPSNDSMGFCPVLVVHPTTASVPCRRVTAVSDITLSLLVADAHYIATDKVSPAVAAVDLPVAGFTILSGNGSVLPAYRDNTSRLTDPTRESFVTVIVSPGDAVIFPNYIGVGQLHKTATVSTTQELLAVTKMLSLLGDACSASPALCRDIAALNASVRGTLTRAMASASRTCLSTPSLCSTAFGSVALPPSLQGQDYLANVSSNSSLACGKGGTLRLLTCVADTVSATVSAPSSTSCGTGCIIAVVLGSVGAVATVVAVVLTLKKVSCRDQEPFNEVK